MEAVVQLKPCNQNSKTSSTTYPRTEFVNDIITSTGVATSMKLAESRLYAPERDATYRADCAFVQNLYENTKDTDAVLRCKAVVNEMSDIPVDEAIRDSVFKTPQRLASDTKSHCLNAIEHDAIEAVLDLTLETGETKETEGFIPLWTNTENNGYTQGVWGVRADTLKQSLTAKVNAGDERAIYALIDAAMNKSGLPAKPSGLLRTGDQVFCLNLNPNDQASGTFTTCAYDDTLGFRDSVYAKYQPGKLGAVSPCEIPPGIDPLMVEYLRNTYSGQ